MSELPPYSKKGQRWLSTFVGQELLFDFITNQLDDERKKAVSEFVAKNKDAQNDIQKIQNGITYASRLGETKVSEALLKKVTLPPGYLEVLIQKIRFDQWSPALKLAIEGTIVAFGVTSLIILVPWHKLMDLKIGSTEVLLTEIDNHYVKKSAPESETSSKEEESFPDEGAPAAALQAKPSVAASQVPTPLPLSENKPEKASEAVAKNVTKHAQSELPAESSEAEKPAKVVNAKSSADKKAVGELYRGQISVTNVAAITPKLVEKLAELGGRKAGQVELGWNKNDSSYFHFTMPQSHYDELVEYLKEYGNLKIQKEKHERVMPEGVMRLIITVEEKR